jgi:predicted nucleic-acid-binding protein
MRFDGSLDANVLLRFILGDVENQSKAAISLLESSSGQLAVADQAFVEVVFVLEKGYEMARADIVAALEGIISLPVINCNRVLLSTVLPHYLRSPALSFVDCCLATYADLNDATPLYTFDRKLANQLPSAKLLVS